MLKEKQKQLRKRMKKAASGSGKPQYVEFSAGTETEKTRWMEAVLRVNANKVKRKAQQRRL